MMRRVPRFLSLRTYTNPPSSTRHSIRTARSFLSYTHTRSSILRRQYFHTSVMRPKGLSPTSTEPEPPRVQFAGGAGHVSEPANPTTDEYHDLAHQYIDALVL